MLNDTERAVIVRRPHEAVAAHALNRPPVAGVLHPSAPVRGESLMPVTREIQAQGWCVRLDLSRQVLGLEVPEFVLGWRPEGEQPGALLPIPPAADEGPVSAATLLLKAKQFDDGLYAAVELAAQRGAGRFAGKAVLFRSLAA